MASPQKEHVYTAIANEIMEALAKVRIPGELRQVLDYILRRTYGWNKKEAAISHREFMLATGLKRQNVSRALKKLADLNMIGIRIDASRRRFYCFNKDFDTWKKRIKTDAASKLIRSGIKLDASVESKMIPSMPYKPNNDKGLQDPKTTFKANIKQSLYRERLLERLKTLFPDSRIPDPITNKQIDYFLFRVEKGLDYRKVQDPVRYIKSLIVDEGFPPLLAREGMAKEKEAERIAESKRQREEFETFRQENNAEMRKKIKTFVSKIAGRGMGK